MKKFYKLGAGQGMFWDPTQSDKGSQKIAGNQIAYLESTAAVTEAKRHGRLEEVSEEEAQKYYKKNRLDWPIPAPKEGKKPAADPENDK